MFLYGGSTVILMLERDHAELASELFAHTADGLETPVRMGERIGMRK
jgi:phosphatidylserine decarboxylase